MNIDKIVKLSELLCKSDDTGIVEIVRTLNKAVRAAVQNGVEGNVVEFGTMTGRTALALGHICKHYFNLYRKNDIRHKLTDDRKLHLFDSFIGLPKATAEADLLNPHVLGGIWAEGTCKGYSRVELETLIERYGYENFTDVFEGWFSHSLNLLPEKTAYAVIHVDCDLYSSTIDSLGFLFEKGMVSRGAQVLFDDFNCSAGSNEFGERRAWAELVDKHSIGYENLGFYAVSGARFLIEDYS